MFNVNERRIRTDCKLNLPNFSVEAVIHQAVAHIRSQSAGEEMGECLSFGIVGVQYVSGMFLYASVSEEEGSNGQKGEFHRLQGQSCVIATRASLIPHPFLELLTNSLGYRDIPLCADPAIPPPTPKKKGRRERINQRNGGPEHPLPTTAPTPYMQLASTAPSTASGRRRVEEVLGTAATKHLGQQRITSRVDR